MSAAGDEDEDESGEERLPSCFDYVMHFLTVFWKVLFACVPPTEYCHGWACFVVSILIIGMLTAVIGDLASHFGCTIGLKDSVTAVVFVAFGTSVPGKSEGGPGFAERLLLGPSDPLRFASRSSYYHRSELTEPLLRQCAEVKGTPDNNASENRHSLDPFDVSGSGYATQLTWFLSVMLTRSLHNRDHYYPHVTNEETEAHGAKSAARVSSPLPQPPRDMKATNSTTQRL